MMSGADILTCLLVDDDELFREGLLRAIRGLRLPLEMKFMQAGSGEEALKKWRWRCHRWCFWTIGCRGCRGWSV